MRALIILEPHGEIVDASVWRAGGAAVSLAHTCRGEHGKAGDAFRRPAAFTRRRVSERFEPLRFYLMRIRSKTPSQPLKRERPCSGRAQRSARRDTVMMSHRARGPLCRRASHNLTAGCPSAWVACVKEEGSSPRRLREGARRLREIGGGERRRGHAGCGRKGDHSPRRPTPRPTAR